jgi:hypothetical protein
MTDSFEVNAEDVTHERLDGEVVAINMRTGRYYSLSGPAADVWWLIDQRNPRGTWIQTLQEAYPTGHDWLGIEEFIDGCTRARLIRPCPDHLTRVSALPRDFIREDWTMPRLEEFEDLQDLILVDPIHDTTALGWPHVADQQ